MVKSFFRIKENKKYLKVIFVDTWQEASELPKLNVFQKFLLSLIFHKLLKLNIEYAKVLFPMTLSALDNMSLKDIK